MDFEFASEGIAFPVRQLRAEHVSPGSISPGDVEESPSGPETPTLSTILGGTPDSTTSSVTDAELLSSMRFSSILGVTCLVVFGALNAIFKMYRIRLSLRRVTVKPPQLPKRRLSMIWMWMWKALTVPDEELLRSAGLDAFMLVKTFGIGIQMFFPLALFGCCILIPIHKARDYAGDMDSNGSTKTERFLRLTASNVKPGSPELWAHFFCVYVFVAYALVLLDWHMKRYIRLRHQYLSASDECNVWRDQTLADSPAPARMLHRASLFRSFMTTARNFFVDELSKRDIRKGLLSRLATMNRDEAETVFQQVDESPSQAYDSRSCRSLPDEDDLYQGIWEDDAECGSIKDVEVEKMNGGNNEIEESKDVADSSSIPGAKLPTNGSRKNTFTFRRSSVPSSSTPAQNGEDKQLKLPNLRSPSLPVCSSQVPTRRNRFETVASDRSVSEDFTIWKWWLLKDGVTEVYSQRASEQHKARFDLPRPSVRFLKTVNVDDDNGAFTLAVNAQQYCVLLTNFPDIEKTNRHSSFFGGDNFLCKSIRWFFQEISIDKILSVTHIRQKMDRYGFLSYPKQGAWDTESQATNNSTITPKKSTRLWDKLRSTVRLDEEDRREENVVAASFRGLFGNDFVRAVPISNHKEIDLLVFEWDRLMGILERCEEYHARTGKECLYYKRKWWSFLTCYQLGCEKPVDAIEHYTDLINDLEESIATLRVKIMRSRHTPSWILIFRNQKTAAIASQALLHTESGVTCHTEPAPGPDEINWQALWKTQREKNIRLLLVTPLIFLLIAFPLGIFAGSLSSLNTFICDDDTWIHWDWYCDKNKHRRLITGWIPSILVSVWQNMVMPNALYYLVQASAKCVSLSQLERYIAHLFFLWDVFNIYIGGMIGGTVLLKVNEAVRHPENIMHLLGIALPASSNFFVNYICLRAFFLLPYQLLVPHPGVFHYLLRFLGFMHFARTPRDRARLWAPRSVRYGREYGLVLLMFMITLGYSVISPIIVPIALIYFLMAWLVWRYQILYVYVRKYESGARMWPLFVKRTIFSLWLFQFLTSCVLLTKEAYWQAALLWVTVPIILHRFNTYCDRRFEPGLTHIPLEMAQGAPDAYIDPKVYTPPALLRHCAGWHPEYMKAWEGWGSPAYTI